MIGPVRRAAGLVTLLALACTKGEQSADTGRAGSVPPIEHVFVIVLENKDYGTTFGPPAGAPYLADTLVRAGALLRQYYGTGHLSLDNYIAMISGIAPDPETQMDCPRYIDFVESGTAPDGQPQGRGCVYPSHVLTIGNQLTSAGRTWKAYLEDMGNDPAREPATCGHGAIGADDSTLRATTKDQYAAKHNPFVYFHAIIDSPVCHDAVVGLEWLGLDLQNADATPAFSFIVPNLCHDGHDDPCVTGEPGGLAASDHFLRYWVPRITKSPAFRSGLLIVTFDEASSTDSSACCDEPTGPNVGRPGLRGPGGGRIGAVLLSPFIAPGTVSDVPYNHYAMLKSVEQIFHLPFLGYAGRPGLAGFGADVYTRR